MPRLPRQTKVDVAKCHACHAKRKCRQVPRLPRETEVHVSKCYAMLRPPRETKVDVANCHACHANGRSMLPCHAKWRGAPGDQRYHACHAKRRPMSPGDKEGAEEEAEAGRRRDRYRIRNKNPTQKCVDKNNPPKKNKCKIAMQKRNAKQIKIKHKKCSVGAKTQMSKMLLDTRLIHIQGGVEDVQSRLPGFHAFQFLPLPHMQYVTHPLSPHNFVTHHVSHTLFHTQLCHTSSFTHHFVTHHFSPHHPSHTTLSHTIFHHTIFHTQLCHTPSFATQLCHTSSFTHTIFHTQFVTHSLSHNFVTRHLSHTTLSHTIFHTQFYHTQLFTYTFVYFLILHHLLCLSFLPRPVSTFVAHYWKKLTCEVIRLFNSASFFVCIL